MTAPTDALGVPIVDLDVVTVIAYGGPVRLADVGRRSTVVGFTAKGNVLLVSTREPIANGRAVPPACVAVARRDGTPGHEGNRNR